MKDKLLYTVVTLITSTLAQAKVVEYELNIDERILSPAGKAVSALTLNGSIPGPTLIFEVGDQAKISVTNKLAKQDTSIHWHGLLVPNKQDGVPYLTNPPITPGSTATYEFDLNHSGTYWYHSHTGFQEQKGVYGSIIVRPKGGELNHADKEYVLVLSDWTDESPKEVMRSLMRGTEYYAIKKGNAQTIVGAIKAGKLRDFMDREKVRMAPMDISDVYYNAFLINGKEVSNLAANPGETIRLRIINAGASTYFYTNSATGNMTVVAADGPPVQPFEVNKLLIGNGETYDVLIKVPAAGSYEFRATAQDGSGHASVFIGEGAQHKAETIKKPELYSMDHMLEAAMGMEMDNMDRPSAPYNKLRSTEDTRLDANAPRRDLKLRLTGDMKRYLWSFDGKTIDEESTISVKKGEVLRITLINDTMMHHPLHLHGHFFRVLNENGKYSPLKHTVDVPPMGKRVIEFLANEEGDWFFHCHVAYHMKAGMARVVSYNDDPNYKPTYSGKTLFDNVNYFVDADVLNTHTMGDARLMVGRNDFGVMWDKSFMHNEEYEIDAYWMRYINQNLSTTLGYRFTDIEGTNDRLFAQVNYRLPYLIDSNWAIDSEGDIRVGFNKELQITDRFSIEGDIEYDTNTGFESSVGASYLINKQLSLTANYHTEHKLGVGLRFEF